MCVSFSRTYSGLYIYHLFAWSRFNFLHNFQWITLHTQSCQALHSFWPNLLNLHMWSMISSLSPQNLHLLFCCVLTILALIWLVLMALFCAAIRKDSFSLLRFPFLSPVHVYSYVLSLVSRLNVHRVLFFRFLFSGYYRSLDPLVISIASGGCNQSSSAPVVFALLYRWVNAVFNAPFFLDIYSLSTLSLDPRPYAWTLVVGCFVFFCFFFYLIHLFEFFSGQLQEWIWVSYEGDSPSIYPFGKVPAIEFFFNFSLFDGDNFHVFLSFFFSELSEYFLIW